ncbi:MAG TPA: hypothetical protein VGP93_00570 [Polyangiaceae bacterium]|jgi:Mn-dependent DtxR family transcriptional regulator|nr:hypothetical protein [Polyangiaceae bacterium]
MQLNLSIRILQHIFRRAGAAAPTSRPALERAFKLDPSRLETALLELEQKGLVDARELRLTLSGLALAVATRRARPLLSAGLRGRPLALEASDNRAKGSTIAGAGSNRSRAQRLSLSFSLTGLLPDKC